LSVVPVTKAEFARVLALAKREPEERRKPEKRKKPPRKRSAARAKKST